VGVVEASYQVRSLWEDLGCPMLVIDAQPDTNETRVLVKSMGRRAMRAKFSGNLNSTVVSTGEDDMVVVDRSRIMEAVKAMVDARRWVFPPGSMQTSAGMFQDRGGTLREYTAADHLKAPVLVKMTDKHGNEVYDFPKDAMEGIDPHFYMAACLAQVGIQSGTAPGRVITVAR